VGQRGLYKVQGIIIFFYGEETKIINYEQDSFVHHRTVKRVQFVSDNLLVIILRVCRCNLFVVNVHGPSDDERDVSKDSFYEELQQIFNHFLSTT
jgi:hypothetical protein